MSSKKSSFLAGEYVVYPAHGVGKILDISKNQVAGKELEFVVVHFDHMKMTLKVPVANAGKTGLRKLSNKGVMETAVSTLKTKSRVKRAMWCRRQQEYAAKINSGNPVSIAEVVRDLHRGNSKQEQSFGERQIYEQALDRLAHEFAAMQKIKHEEAVAHFAKVLAD